MSLSDCPKCWETPCVCGWEYRNLSGAERLKLGAAVLGIPTKRLAVMLAEHKHESLDQDTL